MIRAHDLLALSDLAHQDIEAILDRALLLRHDWEAKRMPRSLEGARLGLIAELPGWRNPAAFALGASEMGGTCVTVTTGLEGSETIEDLAGYMDNWFDLLAVRTPNLEKLRRFADALESPVLNLRTNDNHPCEILGDLAFAQDQRGTLDGLTVAMVGAAANISRSWAEAATVLPIDVVQFAPEDFEMSAGNRPDRMRVSSDPSAIRSADLIVTDCWPCDLHREEKKEFERFRITAELLESAKPDVLFVPCPPVSRGEEVSADAMQHPRCFATMAKTFLMHTQNAFIDLTIS